MEAEKKGDIKIAVNYSRTTHPEDDYNRQTSHGAEIQSMYALSNHFAVKADFFKRRESDVSSLQTNADENFSLFYKRGGADISVGYSRSDGGKKRVLMSLFAGAGKGNTAFTGTYRQGLMKEYFYSADHFKFFVSPSIRFKPAKNYSIILAYKISSVKFNNILTNDSLLTQGVYKSFATKRSLFGDFVLDNEVGINKLNSVRLHLQIGSSKLLTYFRNDYDIISADQYQYNNFFSSLGIIADLNKIFKMN